VLRVASSFDPGTNRSNIIATLPRTICVLTQIFSSQTLKLKWPFVWGADPCRQNIFVTGMVNLKRII